MKKYWKQRCRFTILPAQENQMAQLTFSNLDKTKSYARLRTMKTVSLKTVLNATRVQNYENSYDLGDGQRLDYNYSAKQIDDHIISALQTLADEQQLLDKYKAIAAGEFMNSGEQRRVLHHLTRGQLLDQVIHEGKNLRRFYVQQQQRIADFSAKIHGGTAAGQTGKPFRSVVQVGIGGSDLGPRALYLALLNHIESSRIETGSLGRGLKLKAHFISNVDPDDAAEILRTIDPATTLFILVSKSGTTQETLANEALVLSCLKKAGIANAKKHIVCVTSETSPLAKDPDYLESFFIDDFIGGRYSSCSAVGGTLLSLAFGADVFTELLEGAHAADQVALETDARKNPALMDALAGVWERNFQNLPSTAVLPYSQALSRFPAHLQQMDMESNGKRINRNAQAVNYETGPVIFGEPGTNGQHSFYQLLHQGSDIIPLQFIGFNESQDGLDLTWQGSGSQQKLNANLAAQIIAFAKGKDSDDPNKSFPGERPSSLLFSQRLTPRVLGALLAHFENKIMFQGLIWNINSFDQEGVQLGKILTKQVLGKDKLDAALQTFSEKLKART